MTKLSRSRLIEWQDPQLTAVKATQMNGLDFFRAWQTGEVPAPPIGVLLNFWLKEVADGRIVFTMQPKEYHFNPIGAVHGGVIATILDSAMSCAVHTKLPVGGGYTTLEIKVNYIRPITTQTGQLDCVGDVIHLGRRMATAEGNLVDAAEKLYAHGTATCMVFLPA
ncbi:MAG: PaaI family thioesterase [Chloroflexi bacterium]|nr:PaaI family thioesterase [Ardenticatenaceae bacterium]MBL1130788.1 PaaI family thioesterase [Chloroflexota bacterium]NOG36884.1 PaaI family thioesterase [Chloroflexota bacterium]